LGNASLDCEIAEIAATIPGETRVGLRNATPYNVALQGSPGKPSRPPISEREVTYESGVS